MKIKNLLIAGSLLLITTAKMNAADLCVAENGTGGCYSTITDAINAATNGDRIIINPKAGGAPYAENLSVTKTLQFLCNVEGGQYAVSGNIVITPAIGRTITFIGMNNLAGNVTATGSSPVGARCKVSIMNCNFANGFINLDWDYFDVSVVSCVFNDGCIQFRYGKAIGNDITTINNYYAPVSYFRTSIYVGTDVVPTNDSIWIVGNKIMNNNPSSYFNNGIFASSTSQFY